VQCSQPVWQQISLLISNVYVSQSMQCNVKHAVCPMPSLTPFKIFISKYIWMTLAFRATWRQCHRSRDQSIRHMPFHIGVPLEPSVYLQSFSRYSAPNPMCTHTYVDSKKERHTTSHFIFCPIQCIALGRWKQNKCTTLQVLSSDLKKTINVLHCLWAVLDKTIVRRTLLFSSCTSLRYVPLLHLKDNEPRYL